MSVEMTPYHLNHLISSTPALGMGGAESLRRHGSGLEPSRATACAPKSPYPLHTSTR